MKASLSALILSILLSASEAYAEPVSFKLRRSLIDRNTIEQPAQLQVTWPGDGRDATYAVDAALNALFGATRRGDTLWEFAASAEYHRNNLVSKEQNTLLGSLSVLGVVGDITTGSSALLPQMAVKYKRDEVKRAESFVSSANLSIASKSMAIGKVVGPDALGFLWQPRVGLEYEHLFQAVSASDEGRVLRGTGCVEVALYPSRRALKEQLEITGSYRYWSDFSRTSGFDNGNRSHDLFKCALKYYFNSDRNFAVAIEHLDGENPSENLPVQKYTQLAFQVRF